MKKKRSDMVNKGLNEKELKNNHRRGVEKGRKVVNKQMLFKFYSCIFCKLITYA